jgi:hypothetical protein
MNKVGFFTPVSFDGKFPTLKNKLLEACDRYLTLSDSCAIVRSEEKKDRVYGAIHSYKDESLVLTALKVSSYFTVILPLLALVAKFILRTTTIVNFRTPLGLINSDLDDKCDDKYRCLEVLGKRLADGGIISEELRGDTVINAAKSGHLEIIQALLANGAISEHDRGVAVRAAADQGGHLACITAIKALLAHGAISEADIGEAVAAAALGGHLDCITALLANRAISEHYRGRAVVNAAGRAAGRDQLEIIKALLANGAISEYYRGHAVYVSRGHPACEQALLPPGTNREAYLGAGGAGRLAVSREDLMAGPR